MQFSDEIPYSTEVLIEDFKEAKTNAGEAIARIQATIFVMRETQKAIILGRWCSHQKTGLYRPARPGTLPQKPKCFWNSPSKSATTGATMKKRCNALGISFYPKHPASSGIFPCCHTYPEKLDFLAVGVYWHHRGGVQACGENSPEIFFPESAAQRQTATFMVARHDYQRFAVGSSKFKRCPHRFIKVLHFSPQPVSVVGMAGPVDLASFHHQEKAFFGSVFVNNCTPIG